MTSDWTASDEGPVPSSAAVNVRVVAVHTFAGKDVSVAIIDESVAPSDEDAAVTTLLVLAFTMAAREDVAVSRAESV